MDFNFDLQMFAVTPWVDYYDEVADSPKYQFKYGEDSTGLFNVKVTPVTENNEVVGYKVAGIAIAEPTTAAKLTKPASGTSYYLAVKNTLPVDDNPDDESVPPITNTVTMQLVKVSADSAQPEVIDEGMVASSSSFTLTAPAAQPLIFDVSNVDVNFDIKKVAANSVISLKKGDNATTGTLAADEKIQVNGSTYTSAGGVLSFVGVSKDDENYGKLQAGNIIMTATAADNEEEDPTPATAQLTSADLTTNDTDGILVKVSGGKVSSITGLDGKKGTEVTEITGTTATTFKTLDDKGTMIEKTVETEDTFVVTYLDLTKSGGEIYKATYKKAVYTSVGNVGKTTGSNKAAYFALSEEEATLGNAIEIADGNTRGLDEDTGKFLASAGGYYLKVTSSTTAATTTAPKTTTISGFEIVKSNAAGTLTKVAATEKGFTGKFTPDVAGQIVKFTKPANAAYTVDLKNVDIRSVVKGLDLTKDIISTKNGTYSNLASGTYTVYSYDNTNSTIDSTVTIASGKVNVTVADGALGDIKGLNGTETVTIAKAGGLTEVYKSTGVKTVGTEKYDTLTIEVTTADGTHHKYENVRVGQGELEGTALKLGNFFTEVDPDTGLPTTVPEYVKDTQSVVADFDWTAQKSPVGYFQATSSSVKVEAKSTSITSSNPVKYLKVSQNDEGKWTLSAVYVNNEGEVDGDFTYKGTITVKAPATAVTFAGRDASLDSDTVIKYTDVAAGSTVTALGKKDTVTTAKLSTTTDLVSIGEARYAGAGTAITVNAGGLFSGTVTAIYGLGATTVGKYSITNTNSTNNDATFTVAAASGKTFTLGALDDGDQFTVVNNQGTEDISDDTTTIYVKYGNYIYGDGKMFSIGTGKTISSAKLDTSKWKEALDVTEAEHTGTSIINLATADKAFASTTYKDSELPLVFVRDKYVTTQPTASTTITANLVDAEEATNAETFIASQGTANIDKTYTGTADAMAQTINVTTGWTVTAGENVDTTFKGAASGTDRLVANKGNDTFMLSGAEDTIYDMDIKGKDTISNYQSGNDKLIFADGVKYTLSKTTANDVYVDDDGYTDGDTDYVLLKGVGGKAVTINDATHFFGNGKTNNQGKTKEDTFTFVDKAFYHGNNSGNNTLKVGTLSKYAGRTTGGNPLDISLQDENGYYENINNIDASTSANEVVLTAVAGEANETGSTLKGGTYKSTLIGGAGNDTFVGGTGVDTFNMSTIAGKDKIQSYNSNQDVISLGDGALDLEVVSAKGNDVVYGTDDANVTIEDAAMKGITITGKVGDTNTTWKLYAGKAKTNNQFTYEQEKGVTNVYVGYKNGEDENYTDTLKVTTSVKDLNPTINDNGSYTIASYQGGKIDLSEDAGTIKDIEVVDASGVKATAAALSEYGSYFIKRHAGVDVTASGDGTIFTGSAFNDKFTCGEGKDYINYSASQGSDIVTGLGLNDVIKLNGLSSDEITALSAENADVAGILAHGLNDKGLSAGGSLTVEAATGYSLKFNKSNNTVTTVANA